MKTKKSTEEVRESIAAVPTGHVKETDPEEKRNVPEDGPSGENTKNNGERGGGLWTSGGHVTSGENYRYTDEERGDK
ncbi:hypothetical protein LX87_05482 [Larkinella arboricola]|uniref:Uncharacterized protein n=1 Tax=Larkinella arboricola TaxID=643671 RepID=A0A327WJV6_LARAB|nr:hypothetical protein [Larkinella arboricola]RAJ90684.1 hypothetical protein LX87_05482 [Larkinella arboricola]